MGGVGVILNLGCGIKVSDHPSVTNLDWSPYLRIARSPLLRRIAPIALDRERRERLRTLPDNIVVHDLANGIPWRDSSVDVVYHSHFLEHLDRAAVPAFMRETLRVLRAGGVHRIVVPDLERAARAYLDHLDRCVGDGVGARDGEGARDAVGVGEAGSEGVGEGEGVGDSDGDAHSADEAARHDEYVAAILEQSVRREAYGTASKRPLRRRVENLLLGDARRRGETHQWMYDRVNLKALLRESGFEAIAQRSFDSSGVSGWNAYGLDRDNDGSEYKPGSLYVEASKPWAEAAALGGAPGRTARLDALHTRVSPGLR